MDNTIQEDEYNEYNKYNNDYIKVSKYEKKEKKCTETYIGKICVDKFNEKRYIPDKNINYEFRFYSH